MKDDHLLIDGTLKGDMQAYRWLVTKHERMVAHVVRRIIKNDEDVEEICQDVFLKVYQKLSTFRGESKFTTWLVSIAYRTSLNFIQKKKLEKVSLDEFDTKIADSQLPSDFIEHEDKRIMIENALKKLPFHYRSVVTLYHLEELGYQEVVEITGMPLGTVKNYLFRARKLLKDLLNSYQNTEHYE